MWRHQILNTQGGVLLWVDSLVWSNRAWGGGGAAVRLWRVTVTAASCGFDFLCPSPAPFPLLPSYQKTMAARWPCSRVETFADTHVTGAVKTMSSRPCRRTRAQPLIQLAQHIVWNEPAAPRSIVEQSSKSRGLRFMMILSVTPRICPADVDSLVFRWFQPLNHSGFRMNGASAAAAPSQHLWPDAGQRGRFFFWGRKGVEPNMEPNASPVSVSKGAGVPGLPDHTACWPPAWSLREQLPWPSLSLAPPRFHATLVTALDKRSHLHPVRTRGFVG